MALVDKVASERLISLSRQVGVEATPEAAESLLWLAGELVRWNQKINLTTVTSPDEVLEKHLVDSVAVAPFIPRGASVLDLGTGAGFPGLPLAVVRPDVRVTLVDSVAKKLGFCRHAAAALKLKVKVAHAHAGGEPEAEGVPRADVVVSRALMDLGRWLPLARAYVNPAGTVLAMLGQAPQDPELQEVASAFGLALVQSLRFALPISGQPRGIAAFSAA